jgi:zinc protease
MDRLDGKSSTIMVEYEKFSLQNGLKVILHNDDSSPMVAINIIYKVGSVHEDPDRTGFAHLFEHLMFGGTKNVKNFDTPVQKAGGENNAFTNNDFTNYYEVLPKENLEVALWLEVDRMKNLDITQRTLNTQKKVVIEEFKETCLNEPYGDMWHILGEMLYPDHPYNWPVIGKEYSHIKKANLDDVQNFFNTYYTPQNSILSICGSIDVMKTKALVERYFGEVQSLPSVERISKYISQAEPVIYKEVKAEVPSNAIILAYRMCDRYHPDYYAIDLVSDILSTGRSSRFYQKLVKEKQLFANIDAYITGTTDDGAFIIDGKVMDGVSIDIAKEAIMLELSIIMTERMDENELRKIKNKAESNLVFSETSILSKAMSLGYYEYLGDIDLINTESDLYEKITTDDILRVSTSLFDPKNKRTLVYLKNSE